MNGDLDLQRTAAALEHWIAQRHPGREAVQVNRLHRPSGGYSNPTLMGEASWREGDASRTQAFVLRVQGRGDAVFPDSDIGRQYRVMQCLQGSAVPVPALLGMEPDAEVLGLPFYLMARVEGRVPDENPLYHLEGWFHDLPPADRRQHWFSGIDTLAAIARIDWRERGLGFLVPADAVGPDGTLGHQLVRARRQLAWAESLGRPYPHLHRALGWLAAHAPRDGTLALSWADAKLGNCVFRDGRVAAALDWEQATIAHPVDDLAWWLMLDDALSGGYGVPRLAGLPSRAETVAHWERASGFSADPLPYHEVFAAWRMALVMARIGTLFMQGGRVAPEAEMDLRNGAATLLAQHARRLGF